MNEGNNAVCCKPANPGIIRAMQQNREMMCRVSEMVTELRGAIFGIAKEGCSPMNPPECLEEEVSVQSDILRETGEMLGVILEKMNA